MATIRDVHGHIDALVLNAGISEPAPLANITTDHFDRHFAVNVRGAVYGLKSAIDALRDGSSVVLMGSVAGSISVSGYGTYAATKAALRSTLVLGQRSWHHGAFARTWLRQAQPTRR